MRALLDKIIRAGIKLCMLTGVTFLVTACYAPANPPDIYGEEYKKDHDRMEQNFRKFTTPEPEAAQEQEQL
jgi:hypothetical protein